MPESESIPDVLKYRVSQYMKRTITIMHESTLIPSACTQMQKQHSDEIIVTNSVGDPVGIVTDEDILRKVGEQHARSSRTKLEDVMSFPLVSISHNSSLKDALDKMRENKIRKLAVISDSNKVIGLIFQHTIVELIHGSIERNKKPISSVRSILWNLGSVTQFAGLLMLIPALVSTFMFEVQVASGIFMMATTLLALGFLLNSYGEKHPLSLQAMTILVFSSFVILVIVGTIPYMYISPYGEMGFVEEFSNSLFSSSAAFTTAGISLFATPEDLPQSFTFFRGFTQFVGGLSFIYLIMTAFYPESKLHNMRGFISGTTPNLRELFVTITIVFSIYVVMIAGLFWVFGSDNMLDNFSLAFSTLSTGGFLPNSNMFSELQIGGEIVLVIGMILGTLPFGFHYGLVRTKFLSVKTGREVTVYLLMLLGAIILFSVLYGTDPMSNVITVVATSTTAGFQVVDMSVLDATPKIFLTLLMIIGGCGFSTAGGIKIFRILNMYDLRKLLRPSGWKKGFAEDKNELATTLLIFALFPTLPLVGALYLSSEGYDFYDSYFETIGAITTAGLGSGILGIDLDPLGKIIASFLMILGRLEIILVIFMFVPKLIRQKQ
ncbi:potassium transporter TrkG [Nitrosopumilus sp.]|uniref:potassium transporter TrkG n=1 Tax=Nitrosopumilus sp. TaxID=2024843 RepID=UPI002623143A|nr:potassium transporter TrkG [Nitrosopumilus sp.]